MTEICVELVTDSRSSCQGNLSEAAPAWAETLMGWEDPAATEKVEGEIVTPWGRLLADHDRSGEAIASSSRDCDGKGLARRHTDIRWGRPDLKAGSWSGSDRDGNSK